MRTRFAYLSTTSFEFQLTRNDAERCSHMGRCDEDVEAVRKKKYVKRQLDELSDEEMKEILKEYCCYDEGDTRDDMEAYIVWLAAGDIVEDIHQQERERSKK